MAAGLFFTAVGLFFMAAGLFFMAAALFFMAACLFFMAAGSFSQWLWFKRFQDLSQILDLSPDFGWIKRRNEEMNCVYRLVLCGWGGGERLGGKCNTILYFRIAIQSTSLLVHSC